MTVKEDMTIEIAMLASANRYLWRTWDHDHEGWAKSELDGFLTLLNHVCAEVQDFRNHVNDTVSEELAPVAETALSSRDVEEMELITAT